MIYTKYGKGISKYKNTLKWLLCRSHFILLSVNEHILKYNANGHRTEDVIKELKANSASDYLNHTMLYEYDPRDRIAKVTKKDTATGNVLETETYKHNANGNVIEQTLDGITTTYTYDRNRLLYATSGGTTAKLGKFW